MTQSKEQPGLQRVKPSSVPDFQHLMGKGFRQAFHALWHLKVLGVVDELSTFGSEAWSEATGPVPRIAVIDTPVAYTHPNLVGAVDLARMRDFSVYDEGIFTVPEVRPSGKVGHGGFKVPDLNDDELKLRKELRAKIIIDRSKLQDMAAEAMLREIGDGTDPPTDTRPQATPRFFGAHGTAMAGLIGGRPAEAKCVAANWSKETQAMESDLLPTPLPYAGINPFCSIVPISTSAAPEPAMVLGALTYASFIEADIIVIAAAWEDTAEYKRNPSAWGEVDAAIANILTQTLPSGKKPIVICAAGNSGKIALAYPACLSKAGGVLAVTAQNAEGQTLGYAPEVDTNLNMISVLSSSAVQYDEGALVFDPWQSEDDAEMPAKDDPALKADMKKALPLEGLISLDVPGPFGYNPSPYAYTPPAVGPHLEIGSLYCHFSGTSAATAVAAGLLSLALQNQSPESGCDKAQQGGLFGFAQAKLLLAKMNSVSGV
jgi:subtilisin family serine protease